MKKNKESKICSADGCDRNVLARGYCSRHYHRMMTYGDLNFSKACGKKDGEDFLRKTLTVFTDECIAWPYSKNNKGYGCLTFQGKKTVASRVMCRIAHGEPENSSYQAAHSCGNGHLGCVNHRHLSWKTAKDNYQDAVKHGTTNLGERNGFSKLKDDDIREIRSMYDKGIHPREIAPIFSTDISNIRLIAKRLSWKHVSDL